MSLWFATFDLSIVNTNLSSLDFHSLLLTFYFQLLTCHSWRNTIMYQISKHSLFWKFPFFLFFIPRARCIFKWTLYFHQFHVSINTKTVATSQYREEHNASCTVLLSVSVLWQNCKSFLINCEGTLILNIILWIITAIVVNLNITVSNVNIIKMGKP